MQRKRSSIIPKMLFVVTELLVATGTILSNVASDGIKNFIRPFIPYAVPLFFTINLAVIVLAIWRQHIEKHLESAASAGNRQNRQRLLEKVNAFWIRGVLDQALRGVTRIPLVLSEQRDAVKNPWRLAFESSYQMSDPLPPETSIAKAYDDAGGELLILGAPGSGKSMLLLELARDLLNRARHDTSHPVPVVFNLSSWSAKRQPIIDWLVQELNLKYQVPQKIGQEWVQNDEILPLLDGLDEVPRAHRIACVAAINKYRQKHGFAKLVVCCRTEEYSMQEELVWLNSAVMILPLTSQQIDDCLAIGGKQLIALSRVLRDNPKLREMAANPLMLNILMTTYREWPVDNLSAGSSSALTQQILTTYIHRMLFRHRERHFSFKPEQSLRYLKWLAQQLNLHNQSIFHLEHMQYDWLPNYRFKWLYQSVALGVIYGLISGISNGLAYLPYLSPWRVFVDGLLIGSFNALLYSLLNGVLFGLLDPTCRGGTTSSVHDQAPSGYMIRAVRILGSRVIYSLFNGLCNGVFVGLLVGPVSGWICGLFTCIFYAALGKLPSEISPAEAIRWSWASMRRKVSKFLVGGASIGLIYGLVNGRSYLLIPEKLLPSLLFGLGIGLLVGLIVGVKGGFSNEMLDSRQLLRPNQGIRNSARYSMLFGLFFGTAFGSIFGLIYGPALYPILGEEYRSAFPTNSGIVYGLSDGLIVAAFFWLLCGGIAVIQHSLLRIFLWRSGYIPWNYIRFLDYASEQLLLRKVGGGYMFAHVLLQDHFITIDPTSENQMQGTLSKPRSKGAESQACPICGSTRRTSAFYCHHCGAKFATDSPDPGTREVSSEGRSK